MQKNQYSTDSYYTPIQLKMPIDLEAFVEISDPIYSFNEVFSHINIQKYIGPLKYGPGRKKFDEDKLLRIVLFAFMDNGYSSFRNIEKLCKTDIRYIWLLDGTKAPSFKTVNNFVNKTLSVSIEDIFKDVNQYLFNKDKVDLNHAYIDGTKIEANANKYSWVWKKSCLVNRNKLFIKITNLFQQINTEILYINGTFFQIREEYSIEYMEFCIAQLKHILGERINNIPSGKGHRKTMEQRLYQTLCQYTDKLKEYAKHIEICGENRNSYSKTDKGATFMRVKSDYMGNGRLLPAYNMQIAICDEYISAVDVQQYAADMDCFVPLMEKFNTLYGKYPQYPVADAGYGSYNNYLYCAEHGMEKYMKFTMFDKESKDPAYREDIFRAKNFKTNETGELICPNGRKFIHIRDVHVKYNKYGRTEEIHQCEDCSDCPLKAKCSKSSGNRTIRINRELTAIHQEVLDNLNSIHGALLRMNRSIQSEGTFGILKWDKGYERVRRRGIKSVILEFLLISIGFNLYKYHNKRRNDIRMTA